MNNRVSKSSGDQHKEHVLRDPEFLESANALKVKFVKKYGKYFEPEVTLLGNQVSISVSGKDIGKSLFEEIREIAVDYRIHLRDVVNFISSIKENHFPIINHEAVVGATSLGQVFINIAPSTTLKEIKDIWESEVIPMKELAYGVSNVKNKPPESDDLIYAVFRQRQNGKTFPQILKMYEAGTLPGCKAITKQFFTPVELSKYYKKYEPYIADR